MMLKFYEGIVSGKLVEFYAEPSEWFRKCLAVKGQDKDGNYRKYLVPYITNRGIRLKLTLKNKGQWTKGVLLLREQKPRARIEYTAYRGGVKINQHFLDPALSFSCGDQGETWAGIVPEEDEFIYGDKVSLDVFLQLHRDDPLTSGVTISKLAHVSVVPLWELILGAIAIAGFILSIIAIIEA